MRKMAIFIAAILILNIGSNGCKNVSGKKEIKNAPAKSEAEKEITRETAIPKPAVEPEKKPSGPAVEIALKFTKGDTTRYKVVMEASRKVDWQGPVTQKPEYKGGVNLSKAEITFTQKIEDIESNGNAKALITIEGLKYSLKSKETYEFDSAEPKDANNPMNKIIGKSYTIEIAPSGQVTKVLDVNSAAEAVKGSSQQERLAARLLDAQIIKDRHGTLRLADKKLSVGENWKIVRTFPFDWMGTVSYEKIYTLKNIEKQIALIEMNAIPTNETEPNKESMPNKIAKTFDNKGTYKGELNFDIDNGKVDKYTEDLQLEWVTAKLPEDPNKSEPTALTMSATRFYSIEKLK